MLTKGIQLGYLQAVWTDLDACPASPKLIFPTGIEGMEIIEVAGPPFPRLKTSNQRPPVGVAWGRVWNAVGISTVDPVPNAIQFRGLHARAVQFDEYRMQIEAFALETIGPVFVLADSRREDIAAILGGRMIYPSSPPMADDADRTAESVISHLADLRRFLSAGEVISNSPTSTAMWARAVTVMSIRTASAFDLPFRDLAGRLQE